VCIQSHRQCDADQCSRVSAVAAPAGKLDQARELSGLLLAAYPGDAGVTMLQAVLLAKSGKVSRTSACAVPAALHAADNATYPADM
jgi:hypothetical protein